MPLDPDFWVDEPNTKPCSGIRLAILRNLRDLPQDVKERSEAWGILKRHYGEMGEEGYLGMSDIERKAAESVYLELKPDAS